MSASLAAGSAGSSPPTSDPLPPPPPSASSPTSSYTRQIKSQPPDPEDSGSESGNSPNVVATLKGASASAASTPAASGNQIVGADGEAYLNSDDTAQFESDKRLVYK